MRVVEQAVVAVARAAAREDAVVEAEQADDAMRDRPHRHERADRQVAGAEVRARRASLQPLGEQRADLGQGDRRVEPVRLRDRRVEQALELRALPRVARAGGAQRVGGVRQRHGPGRDRLRSLERGEGGPEPVDELGEAAGEVDRAAVDVVERQHAVDDPLAVLGHRHAEQEPVEPAPPRAGRDVGELERRAVLRVEPPADPALGDPVLEPADVVVVEPEAAADRLAVGEVEHLRGGQPRVGEVEQAGDGAEHRVGLAQRAVGEPDAQVRRPQLGRQRVVLVLAHLARPERRVDQRRERLDVGAHDDHVARLERRVLVEPVQDRVAERLDLARAAVAGVDLDAAVARVGHEVAGGRAIGAHVGLDPGEERPLRVRDRMVVVDRAGARDDELQLARVVPPRAEQPVADQRGRAVLGAAEGRLAARERLPQRRRRMQDEQVDVATRAERAQHLEVGRGQARQAEQADARRERDQPGLRAQARAPVRQPLGRRRHADPRAQPAPQLRLPVVVVLALGPAEQELGPVRAVAVEQAREMAHGGEAAGAADGVVGAAEVGGEVARPRLLQRAGDHVEQRPDQPLGQPRVGLRIDARDGGDRVADQHPRGREADVGADPEAVREPLGQPALHPARGDRDDLGGERVLGRIGEDGAQREHQPVGAFGSVDVQHARRPGSRPGPSV